MKIPRRNIKDKVLAFYRKHPTMPRGEMVARLGFPAPSVSVVLQRAGLTKPREAAKAGGPHRKYRRLQDWERAAIASAYIDGEKLEALAAEFGIDCSTVSRVAERAGLPRRTSSLKIKMPIAEATTLLRKKRALKAQRMERLRLLAEQRAAQ